MSVRDWGNRVDLRVDDSGPGIPEDERDAVFDRFHRATEAVAGTGLGLAIADSVVRSTQGKWAIGVAELGGARNGDLVAQGAGAQGEAQPCRRDS